jgi:hypoxanthine-guanine phosphoribosyltransferase
VQVLESIKDLSKNIPQGCTLFIYDLQILGVLVGSQNFATHFLNEVLCCNLNLGLMTKARACKVTSQKEARK